MTKGGGGVVPHPKENKGEPRASAAHAGGARDEGTTKGVVGEAEKEEAAQKGATKDQHGRGHRRDD